MVDRYERGGLIESLERGWIGRGGGERGGDRVR